MKTKKEIEERIEDIDNAMTDLHRSGNLEEARMLIPKVEALEWVLGEDVEVAESEPR